MTAAPVQEAHAQTLGESQSQFNRASVYRYADANDVVIRVNVWGAVRNPGIYEVPRGMDLNTLFSAAGGPSLEVRRRNEDQTIRIRLEREIEEGVYNVIYEETMEDDIVVPTQNPELQGGDILTIQSSVRRGISWRDLLGIGTSLASLVLTAVSLATR